MPDLEFRVLGVEAAAQGLTPLLHFKLEITSEEPIQGVILNTQIQIQSPQRAYNAKEKERLLELFGTPDRWGQTLRNRLWTQTHINVGAFAKKTEAVLPVQCTYDLSVASTKYFQALDAGDVSLLFLFSGSVFYVAEDGRLQLHQISWNKECTYSMPVRAWQNLMEQHYPNSGFICLHRDVLEKLYAFKREQGFATWEQTLEILLNSKQDLLAASESGQVECASRKGRL